jgi:hypothetical protein
MVIGGYWWVAGWGYAFGITRWTLFRAKGVTNLDADIPEPSFSVRTIRVVFELSDITLRAVCPARGAVLILRISTRPTVTDAVPRAYSRGTTEISIITCT